MTNECRLEKSILVLQKSADDIQIGTDGENLVSQKRK